MPMNRYVVLGLVNALILLALSGGAVFDIMDRCGALTMCRRGPGLGTWAMAVLPLLLIAGAALVFSPRMVRAWKARRTEGAANRAAKAEVAELDSAAEDNARARLGRLSRGNAAPVVAYDDRDMADDADDFDAGYEADGPDATGDILAAPDFGADGDTTLEQIFASSEPEAPFDDDALDLTETVVEHDADDAGYWPAEQHVAPPMADEAEAVEHAYQVDDADVVEPAGLVESPAASHGWTFAVETDADAEVDVDAVDQEALPPAADDGGEAEPYAVASDDDGPAPADRLSFAAADDVAGEEAENDVVGEQQFAAFDSSDGEEFGWPVVRSGDALAETLSAADESYASLPVASFGAASAGSEAEVSPFASWLVAPGPVPRMRPAADTGFPWVAAMIGAVARSMLDHVDRRALGEFAAEVEAWVQIADEMPASTPIGAGDADAFIGWLDTLAQHLFLFGARPSLDVLITHALAELLDRAADDDALANALPPVLLGGRDSAANAA